MNDKLTSAITELMGLHNRHPNITVSTLLSELNQDYSFSIWRIPRILLGLSKTYRDNQHAKAIEKAIKAIRIVIDNQPYEDACRRLGQT